MASGIDPLLVDLCSDAQTNGGLFLAVAPERAEVLAECLRRNGMMAALIGEVTGQSRAGSGWNPKALCRFFL